MLTSLIMALAVGTTEGSPAQHLCGIDRVVKTGDGMEITFAAGFNGGILIMRQDAAQTVLKRYLITGGKVRGYIMLPPDIFKNGGATTVQYDGPILDTAAVPNLAEADVTSSLSPESTCEAKSAIKDGKDGLSLDTFSPAVRDGKDVFLERTEFIAY